MSSSNKRTLIIVLLLDIVIISLIAFFLLNPKRKPVDVVFQFDNEEEITREIAVNEESFSSSILRVTINEEDASELIRVDDSNLDLTKVGTYKVIYYIIYKDKKYEQIQTVNVVDKINPTITLTGKDITILLKETYKEPGYTASDNYDGDITEKVEIDNQIDNTKVGTYKIIYKVTDSSGNTTKASREVKVKKPNAIVVAPKETKVVIPKVTETSYNNTIKKNKFTSTSVILEGYLKEPLEENKIRLVAAETKEYPLTITNNHYNLTLNIGDIPNGTYKVYINEEPLLNKMAEIERISRAKVGNKLVTFTYDKDEVSIKIENHAYSYDILINPGHGADDTGAINEYITEKEMNLKVSMYEKCRYEAHGLRVYITRTSNDTYSKNFGPSSAIRLHKLAYEMGYYGAVSKIVYSNHHNSIGNNYYMGYEILVAGELTSSELSSELNIANKWNNIYTFTENHLRFYARDYDTEKKYSKLNGEVYTFKNNYAVNRIPLALSNVKSIIYEGCYMSNKNDFKWYWQDEHWHEVSEAKIETYVKSLGINYNSDNASCL